LKFELAVQNQMLSPINSSLSEKLKDRGYRTRFFRGRVQDEIAYQLRIARKKRNLTQPQLEKLSGMKQSAISRIEQAAYSRWNFKTLLRLAGALDVRVNITLDPAEDVIKEYERRERNLLVSEYTENTLSPQTLLGNWTSASASVNSNVLASLDRTDQGYSVTKAAYL
jgi:transcriptional regulator with XRE-family HTH domain